MSRARLLDWLFVGLLVVVCVPVLGLSPAYAEDETPGKAPGNPAEGVAWFSSLKDARKVALDLGRPVFVAMHVRPRVASPTATERTRRWLAAYADPAVVKLSRQMACVLRVISAPEGKDPDTDEGAPAAIHLVVDGTSRVLARLDADVPAVPGALERLLRRGLRNHGPVAPDVPLIGRRALAKSERRLDGVSPMRPVAVPLGVPGVRVRLRWELPAPTLRGDGPETVKARVLMRWDDVGPFLVGALAFRAGDEIDAPIDIRFDEHEGLAKHTEAGLHRVDLYLDPDMGSYPFSKGPLHVGRVWIELGDGGGGGGGGADQSPEPEPDPNNEDEEQPDPMPDGKPEEPPPQPGEVQDDVIDPFVGEGETVKKDDALVAVEDDDAGVKPPQLVPLEEALREFEKEREREIGREDITPLERAFLRRYFQLLHKHAQPKKTPRVAPKKAAPKKAAPKKAAPK